MLLKKSKLYVILDAQVQQYDNLLKIAKKAINAGVTIVQLRDKQGSARDTLRYARRLQDLVGDKAIFVVNDRVDIALSVKADALHLGQGDFPLTEARKLVGSKMMIGVSAQNVKHVQKAEKEGADYLGFGSVFKTLTKPERHPMDLKLLKSVLKHSQVPLFPIGGIDEKNVIQLRNLGAKRCAVCRSVCDAKDIKSVVHQFLNIFES